MNKRYDKGITEKTLAVAIEGVEVYDGWQQDGQTFGHNTQKQIVGATGGIAGAAIGAKYGALSIGSIGTFFFGPVETIVGGIIGGFVFGVLGGVYGEEWAEDSFDVINDNKEMTNE